MTARSRPNCLVVIASPDTTVRNRWKKGLGGMFEIQQVAARSNLEGALLKLKPSVLVIDLNLPHLDGIKGLMAIQRLSSMTKIIVLTETGNENEQLLALEAGAKGYCDPDTDPVLMKKAVQIVQKGEIWARRSAMLHFIKQLTARNQYWELTSRTQTPVKLPSTTDFHMTVLTAREREIANLVSQALTNKQIASLLNITEATVKAHLTVIFRKLGVSDRVALALITQPKPAIAYDRSQLTKVE
jgi:two-component system, NarL family, nitrate/nitrite response regulator NarL